MLKVYSAIAPKNYHKNVFLVTEKIEYITIKQKFAIIQLHLAFEIKYKTKKGQINFKCTLLFAFIIWHELLFK